MRRYLLKILIFFSIAGILDVVFGYYCRSMQPKAMYGNNHDIYHIANNANEDIIMMGSSRCHHHFVPSIISDTMKMSCYNAGCDGNGIIYQYGLLQLMLRSHKPKIIIYDFFPEYDISKNDNLKYLDNLKPYVHESCINDIFKDFGFYERIKTYSSFYVFNSKFVQLIKDVKAPFVLTSNGYLANNKVMNYEPLYNVADYDIDSLKLQYWNKFIKTCRDNEIDLVITFSPFYKTIEWKDTKFINNLCNTNRISFLNYYGMGYMNDEEKCYQDPAHLNDLGARKFSSQFASDLKTLIYESHLN